MESDATIDVRELMRRFQVRRQGVDAERDARDIRRLLTRVSDPASRRLVHLLMRADRDVSDAEARRLALVARIESALGLAERRAQAVVPASTRRSR